MQYPELVELDTLADLVVAYPGPRRRRKGRIIEGGELIGAEPLLFGGCGGVVAVDVDDHWPGLLVVDIAKAEALQFAPHVVHVEEQLATLVALARARLLLLPGLGRRQHLRRLRAWHDHHTVVVADHHVAGFDRSACTRHGHVDRPEPLLHRALRGHALGPHRELHRGQFGDVAATGVDHQSAHTACGQGRREQLTEISIFRRRFGRDDQHVTRLALFDGDMDHPVVVGRQADGDRRPADPGTGVDGRHVRRDQAGAALRLVNRGHPVLPEGIADLRVGARRIADDDRHAHFSFPSHGINEMWMTSLSPVSPASARIAWST